MKFLSQTLDKGSTGEGINVLQTSIIRQHLYRQKMSISIRSRAKKSSLISNSETNLKSLGLIDLNVTNPKVNQSTANKSKFAIEAKQQQCQERLYRTASTAGSGFWQLQKKPKKVTIHSNENQIGPLEKQKMKHQFYKFMKASESKSIIHPPMDRPQTSRTLNDAKKLKTLRQLNMNQNRRRLEEVIKIYDSLAQQIV